GPSGIGAWLPATLTAVAWLAWSRGLGRVVFTLVLAACACAGIVLGGRARHGAIDTPLRGVLDREFGGFAVDAAALPGQRAPIPSRFTLTEDASTDAEGSTLRAVVTALRVRGEW